MAGREYDQESKLYYMRARYYDPELGRFISEDPIGIAGGLNLYKYAGNDPVNGRDPSGLDDGCKEEVQMAALSAGDTITLPPVPVCGERDGNPTLPPGCPPGATVCYQPPLPPPGDPNNPMFDPPGNNPQPQPRPVDVGEAAVRKCQGASFALGTTASLDLTFFGGALKAVNFAWSGRAAIAKGISLGARGLWNYGGRGSYLFGLREGARASAAAAGTAADEVATSPMTVYNAVVSQGDLNWRDFVPGWATKRAYEAMRAACYDLDK